MLHHRLLLRLFREVELKQTCETRAKISQAPRHPRTHCAHLWKARTQALRIGKSTTSEFSKHFHATYTNSRKHNSRPRPHANKPRSEDRLRLNNNNQTFRNGALRVLFHSRTTQTEPVAKQPTHTWHPRGHQKHPIPSPPAHTRLKTPTPPPKPQFKPITRAGNSSKIFKLIKIE